MSSAPLFGTVPTFRKAYPEVRTARLEITHRGDVDHQRIHVYSESNMRSKIPCTNPLCWEGRYDLNTLLMTLTHGKAATYQSTFYCNGREGSARTRARRYPCMNSVEVSIALTYNE